MVEVKICGLCRPEDAVLAAGAGAAYVGVVLAPGFARTRDPAVAAEILASVSGRGPGGTSPRRVGVFVNAPVAVTADAATRLKLDVVQLHGGETPDEVEAVARAGPWQVWKALRPRSPEELLAAIPAYAGVGHGILLDGWSPGPVGGTGTRLPWRDLAAARRAVSAETRIILAGGLTPRNVSQAIHRLEPDVVDVSSGVERALGEKSAGAVQRFIAAARAARAARGRKP